MASAKKIINICEKRPVRLFNISCRQTKLTTAPGDRLRHISHRYMRLGRNFDARPRYLHIRSQLKTEHLMESEMVLTLVRLLLVSCMVVFSEFLPCRSESWKLVWTFAVGPISLRDSRALSLSGSSGQFQCQQCAQLGYNSTVFQLTPLGKSWRIL